MKRRNYQVGIPAGPVEAKFGGLQQGGGGAFRAPKQHSKLFYTLQFNLCQTHTSDKDHAGSGELTTSKMPLLFPCPQCYIPSQKCSVYFAGFTTPCVCAIVLPCRVQWHMCSHFGATITNHSAVRKCVVDYVHWLCLQGLLWPPAGGSTVVEMNRTGRHLFSLKENCSSGEWHYKLLVRVTTEMNSFIPPTQSTISRFESVT